jgi:hypothetical protein
MLRMDWTGSVLGWKQPQILPLYRLRYLLHGETQGEQVI